MSGSERDRAAAIALAGRRAGKPLREIAVDVYGRERVDACWHAGSPLRAKARRLLYRAGAVAGAGRVRSRGAVLRIAARPLSRNDVHASAARHGRRD